MSTPLASFESVASSEGIRAGHPAEGRRLLAVAEVQQALRELRSRQAVRLVDVGGDTASEPRKSRGDRTPGRHRAGGDSDLPTGWITVLAGHAGAGASTVALAISDAAAVTGRSAHLIDNAHPARSGLGAAASAELGIDDTGTWRRGLRSTVTISRRATDAMPSRWPVPAGHHAGVTVLDVGLDADGRASRTVDRACTVVVCRPTVPGVRLTEALLDQLRDQVVVIAAVGARRWPGEVAASSGPRLRALRLAGQVVAVPLERRLEVTGLTGQPLPSSIQAAGRALLALLSSRRPGVALTSVTTTSPGLFPGASR
ncbi:hypothetical protein GCM10023328_39980 [Modestobacter marinus]|uniref:MinD-like ATPase involved in chromosome partitioning or flagellar assembly n=1 Tax=Modestobacter marinus TaxID=477641 RepID=A0A846LUU4_9ACTN|nr:hypothetical protein [Modestobacter marinus]NIH69238.1 hypothetical protein [Modestobacter marinus]GGL85339.1 hypothetical protein GCM10011589_47210 [Modestobacter marinus]